MVPTFDIKTFHKFDFKKFQKYYFCIKLEKLLKKLKFFSSSMVSFRNSAIDSNFLKILN
jgi:hypothetical protein